MDNHQDHQDLRGWDDPAEIEKNIRFLRKVEKPKAQSAFIRMFRDTQSYSPNQCECGECRICIGRAEAELDILAETLVEE
jgi:7-cyano-7-deazaguanine synthase in queuosine biosynthesis